MARAASSFMLDVHGIPGFFSVADCARIHAAMQAAPVAQARLVGRRADPALRRAELAWVDDLPGGGWIADRLREVVADANRAVFDFALTEMAESAQIARYGAEAAGHFDWHSDIGDGPVARRRKLTVVVQLSKPESYAGGMLELQPSARIVTAMQEQGSATAFASCMLHRVTPVTRGERLSLTVWAHGPAFR